MALTKEQYLADPCGASSLPYWKAKNLVVPAGMRIVHHREFRGEDPAGDGDETYFRLLHDLRDLSCPALPRGFTLGETDCRELAAHIRRCYDGIGVSEAELQRDTRSPVYDPSLWLAVREEQTGEIVASGIAALDRELGEGSLEWIQVSAPYRGRGLGSFLVRELLHRMQGRARFATVSGQCGNPTDPERLYRRCGFIGTDVWHILKKV